MSIVSNALRKSAGHHDAGCFLNIAGVCDGRGCGSHERNSGKEGETGNGRHCPPECARVKR